MTGKINFKAAQAESALISFIRFFADSQLVSYRFRDLAIPKVEVCCGFARQFMNYHMSMVNGLILAIIGISTKPKRCAVFLCSDTLCGQNRLTRFHALISALL